MEEADGHAGIEPGIFTGNGAGEDFLCLARIGGEQRRATKRRMTRLSEAVEKLTAVENPWRLDGEKYGRVREDGESGKFPVWRYQFQGRSRESASCQGGVKVRGWLLLENKKETTKKASGNNFQAMNMSINLYTSGRTKSRTQIQRWRVVTESGGGIGMAKSHKARWVYRGQPFLKSRMATVKRVVSEFVYIGISRCRHSSVSRRITSTHFVRWV